jgi:hypothetical protein
MQITPEPIYTSLIDLQLHHSPMSYVIHIWEHPASKPMPTDIEIANFWHERFSQISGSPSPQFPALAERLLKQFPYEESFDADDDNIWSEGPPSSGENCVWGLGVNVKALPQLMPCLLEQAKSLGLVVFDMQSGTAYLPNSKIFGRQIEWSQLAASATSSPDEHKPFKHQSEAHAIFIDMMDPILKPHGFKHVKSRHSFVKAYPQVEHELSFYAEGYEPDFDYSMYVGIKAKLKPSEFSNRVKEVSISTQLSSLYRLAPDTAKAPTWKTPRYTEKQVLFQAENLAQLRAQLKTFAQYYEEVVIPVLARCANFKGIDECINNEDLAKRIVPIRRTDNLYFAHLAQNPNIKTLAETIVSTADMLACGSERYTDSEHFARAIADHKKFGEPWHKKVTVALDIITQHPYPWR